MPRETKMIRIVPMVTSAFLAKKMKTGSSTVEKIQGSLSNMGIVSVGY
jgi:hypothetical protein